MQARSTKDSPLGPNRYANDGQRGKDPLQGARRGHSTVGSTRWTDHQQCSRIQVQGENRFDIWLHAKYRDTWLETLIPYFARAKVRTILKGRHRKVCKCLVLVFLLIGRYLLSIIIERLYWFLHMWQTNTIIINITNRKKNDTYILFNVPSSIIRIWNAIIIKAKNAEVPIRILIYTRAKREDGGIVWSFKNYVELRITTNLRLIKKLFLLWKTSSTYM